MKKITFVLFICICAVSFGQSQISTMGNNNPVVYDTNRGVQQTPVSTETSASAVSLLSIGVEHNATYNGDQERHVFNSPAIARSIVAPEARSSASQNILVYTQEMQEEIQAAATWRALNPPTTSSRAASNNIPTANLLLDIIPTAGATETFTPAVGDHFFDPGGPGGSSTGGSPGNYPNCDCDTVTTLDGVTEIEFLDFSVFATFDYIRIYDGADTSGTLLYDNGSGGANSGDITLADMVASNGSASFVGTSGALTFFFHASGVVDYGGWDVEIIAANGGGGGGGGAACEQSHPISANAAGGMGSSVDSDFKAATDIVVTAGEDFTIDTINTTFLTFTGPPSDPPTTANVVYYEDAAGFPGTMIGSETVVPTIVNSQPWVNPVADQYELTMAVTPFTFAGDAGSDTTYWIEVSMGTATNQATVFWEYTNDTPVEGSPAVQFDASVGTWTIPDPTQEVIYAYSGECEPIGGGGSTACNEENLSNGFENAFFTGTGATAPAQVIATDITVDADTDFSLTTVNANLWIRGMGESITGADIVIYGDIAGFPDSGNIIASYPAVAPTSETVLGTAFTDFEVLDVTFDIPATDLPGQAGVPTTYWVSIYGTASNADDVLWESTTATSVGNDAVFSVDNAATWTGYTTGEDMVYNFSGECTSTGGGGGSCTPGTIETLYAAGNNGSPGGAVYFDVTVGAEDIEISTFDLNTADTGAFTVDVYAFEGTYVGNQNTTAPWGTPLAVGSGTGAGVGVPSTATLDTPITMLAGTTYAVALVFDASHSHYYTNGDGTNQNYTNGDITLDLGSASNVPFVDPVFDPRVWNGGIGYCVGGGGGGGGATCEAVNPSNGIENGFFNDEGGAFTAANDLIVNDGEDFEMNQVTLNLFHDVGATITTVNFFYYDNAGTEPGTIIGSELAVVPTSQTVIGNNFGFDVSEVVLDITPFMFEGVNGSDTTYWVETTANSSSGGITAWEATSASYIGNPSVSYDIANAVWIPQIEDGVYVFSGECTAIEPDPTYDTCDGALPIMCGDTVAGSTIGATVDDAVAPTCDTTVTAPGVWYVYEDTTGLVTDITVTMCEGTTDYDTKLSVYTGDCGAPPFTCVAGNDDSCGLQSEVTFQSDGATTFYILVHGFGTATGNFELTMHCTPVPPPNDMIANSIDVDEIGFPYVDPSVAMPAATTEAGTPVGCDNAGAKGVWYNFTPVGDGEATATITSPAGVSSVTFYTAPNESSTETDLELVDWYLNQCLPGTTASIPTVAGQAYYVYVVNHGGITDIEIDGINLGVADNTIEGFSFYPNPADTTINLESVDTIESVVVYSILGQKVIDQNVNATTSQLNVSNLTTGTYFLQVSVNGQIGTYKILKN